MSAQPAEPTWPAEVYTALRERGVNQFAYVPDSGHKHLINAAIADPTIKARLVDLGGTVLPGSPADFGKLIANETEKWAKVVKFSGAKAN